MTTITQKIKVLFNEDLTSYRIGKENGLSAQYVDNYRTGKSKIENMQLGKAEKLIEFYEEYKELQTREVYDAVHAAQKAGTSLDFAIQFNGAVLADKGTGNINGIFSMNGYIGVYGDIIGGQIDSRAEHDYTAVYNTIRKILDYGKPVIRNEVDIDKKFYGEI